MQENSIILANKICNDKVTGSGGNKIVSNNIKAAHNTALQVNKLTIKTTFFSK